MAVADTDGQRTSPRGRRARTRHALAAALLGAWLPLAAAQMGGTGDVHVVVTGGEHAGEYWLTGVEFFLCGFGLPGPGWFSAQYFAESPTAWPSSVQVGHRGPDAAEVDTPDLGVGFGDLAEDGAGYVVYPARGEGAIESQVEDLGDTARLVVTATTSTGVRFDIEVVCHDPVRYGD
jgi:hypothetical protein